MKFDVTTADTSIGAAQYYQFCQKIEGQNMAHLEWGTSNAKSVTLSFWIRSNLTGTYNVYFLNNAVNRYHPVNFTIDSANTWEKKIITATGDTTGTWLTTNGIGMFLLWNLALGSNNLTGTNATWGTAGAGVSGTTQANFLSSTSNELYITGIQLEVGDKATDFEHRSFGDELARCQRYYQRIQSNSTYDALLDGMHHVTTQFYAMHTFPVQMRAEPTMAGSGTFVVLSNGSDRTPDSLILNRATKEVIQTYSALSGGNVGVAGHGGQIRNNNDASTFIEFNAEL